MFLFIRSGMFVVARIFLVIKVWLSRILGLLAQSMIIFGVVNFLVVIEWMLWFVS